MHTLGVISTEAFVALSQQEQIARIEVLGRAALREFGVQPESITSLVHAENTTYRVESPQGKFCLRVSRPGYQSPENIRSEIVFLADLRAAGYPVPEPYEPRVVRVGVPEVPEERDCVLLRWQEGEFRRGEGFSVEDAEKLGELMAHFHAFSVRWEPPAGFQRQTLYRWVLDGLPDEGLETRNPAVSEEDYALLLRVSQQARDLLTRLPRDAENFGLIHADLHQGNVLFNGSQISAIDFDDLGWGFWMNDFASALAYQVRKPTYQDVRDAMLRGYEEVRPLPPSARELVAPFIQIRLKGVASWVLQRQDNPQLREWTGEWIREFCEAIRLLDEDVP